MQAYLSQIAIKRITQDVCVMSGHVVEFRKFQAKAIFDKR